MRCLCRAVLIAVLSAVCLASVGAEAADAMRVATFRCDITPPEGQPLAFCDPIRIVEQPLLAKGIVLEVTGERYVLCALDWCELCDGSHEEFRARLAAAVGTTPAHVAVQCLHQHTAPVVDVDSQKLLTEVGAADLQLDPKVFDAIGQRLAAAMEQSLARLEPFDQIGTGQAKVDRVASSRRPVDASGKICVRYSSCKDPAVRALPEGTIDPYLKTITLARSGKPLVRLHYYATHPQTLYGDGRASSDLPGDAREALEKKENVFQVYFTGCGGDVALGKYNDGSRKCRVELAERLLAGMEASIAATTFEPVGAIRWRTYPLVLSPRNDRGFSRQDRLARMKDSKNPSMQSDAALALAFRGRSPKPIELSSLEIGRVHIVHLPGEPMVCFQLFAQGLKAAEFVAVAGYGDGGPGYLCPAKAFTEGGYEPTDSNVTPQSEARLKKAIAALLGVD